MDKEEYSIASTQRQAPSVGSPPAGPVVDLAVRSRVLFLFTAAFIVGIPFWWTTTTIERLSLPSTRIHSWIQARPCVLRPRISLIIKAGDDAAAGLVSSAGEGLLEGLAQLPGARCLDIVTSEAVNDAYELVLSSKVATSTFSGRKAVVPVEKDPAALRQACMVAASTLLDLSTIEPESRAVKFAPRYKIAISLLNEDSTQPGSLLNWEAHALVSTYIRPLLSSLAAGHDFDVDTSIQYFAPLAIPVARDVDTGGTFVQESDLRAFVNNAEWNMPISNTLDPVLHFMLYVPSSNNRPMRISTESKSNATSFILPQRGGVVLVNPSKEGEDSTAALQHAFSQCRRQLSRILGVTVSPSPSNRLAPEQWQIDAVVRKRLHEASKDSVESLEAIVKLVAQLPNMRVGPEVKAGVLAALEELDLARQAVATSVAAALPHVSRSSSLASKAYFDPTMLALLYFPDEHKYAIYTPLFGPVMVPILVGLLREWREWKERRRQKQKTTKEIKDKAE